MNNKPVALTQVEIMEALTLGIPLYTHPVKEFNVPDGLIDPKSYYIGYEDGKKGNSVKEQLTDEERFDLTNYEIKETELLKTEIFVKDGIIKCYKEALEQIATGGIDGELKNYKDTVYVMRSIASDALSILKKAKEK